MLVQRSLQGRLYLLGIIVCCVVSCVGILCCGSTPEKRACDSTVNCIGKEICVEGLCKEQIKCSSTVDCSSSEQCIQGICVQEVSLKEVHSRDASVAPEHKVEPDTHQSGCTQNSECRVPKVCRQGRCVRPMTPECKIDEDCKSDEQCSQGKCISKVIGCSTDSDCKDGKVCHKGECTKQCFTDNECSTGYRCIDQKCAVSCTSNIQCRASQGFVCVVDKCKKTLTRCQKDEECPRFLACNRQGKCYIECSSNTHCQSHHACIKGVCSKPQQCKSSTAHLCPGGFACSLDSGGVCHTRCSKNNPSVCRLSYQCNTQTGLCEPKKCTKQSDCFFNLACIQGRCKTGCSTDTDCRTNYHCDTGECKDVCTNNSNCNGYLCDTKVTGKCYTKCNSDKDCFKGYRCNALHTCVPKCIQDSDCQNGLLCVRNTCLKKGYKVVQANQPCDRATICAPGYACVNVGVQGTYSICLKQCTRLLDCPDIRYNKCSTASVVSGTSTKVCFQMCRPNVRPCTQPLECLTGICRYRTRPSSGSRKLYESCKEHGDCIQELQCTYIGHTSGVWKKACLSKCFANNRCSLGYACLGDYHKPSSYALSCHKKCSQSSDCPKHSNISLHCLNGFCVVP